MISSLILLISFVYSLDVTFCCPWTNHITTDIELQLHGSGFHREINITVHVESLKRFIDCVIAYEIIIPNGAFVPLNYASNSKNGNGVQVTMDETDIESWSGDSSAYKVYGCSRKTLVNSFTFVQSWVIPIELRYHSPKLNTSRATIKFNKPSVLIRCLSNEIPSICNPEQVQFACDCVSSRDLCSYLPLPPASSNPLVVSLPIGSSSHYFPVFVLTFVSVFVCITAIVHFAVKSDALINLKSE